MRNISLVSLVVLGACSTGSAPTPIHATPTPGPSNTAPAVASCTGGDIVFQVDRMHAGRGDDERTSELVIRSSGAWTYDTLDHGKLVRKAEGCLATPKLAELRAHLDAAPWTVTTPAAVCEIMVINYTEYRIGDRAVWASKGCAGAHLDEASSAALRDAMAIVKPLAPIEG